MDQLNQLRVTLQQLGPTQIGEEPVEAPEARVSLTNIAGTVYRAHRW